MTTKNKHIIEARAKGFDKTKSKVKGVTGSLKGMAMAAASVAAAMQGARMLLASMKESIQLAAKQEMAEKKLQAALGRTSFSLQNQAKALQRVTRFGDETIMEAQAMIAAFEKDEVAVAAATKATLDLAAAKGFDLVAAADLVSKTLGSSTNALTRYGIEVKGAVGSTERLTSLTENIAAVFGGQAAAQADTYQGSLDQMNNAIGDLGESLGSLLLPSIQAVTEGLKVGIEFLDDWIGTNIEQELKNEALEFKALSEMLITYNDEIDMRNTIIAKLQQNHPDFIKALDDEFDNTEKLRDVAKDYNEALELRQRLQLAELISSKANQKYADETFKAMETLAKLQVRVEDAYVKIGMSSEDAAKATKKIFTEGLTSDVGKNAEMILNRIGDATVENSDLLHELFGEYDNLRALLLATPFAAVLGGYELRNILNENTQSTTGFMKVLNNLQDIDLSEEFQTYQNTLEAVTSIQTKLNDKTEEGSNIFLENKKIISEGAEAVDSGDFWGTETEDAFAAYSDAMFDKMVIDEVARQKEQEALKLREKFIATYPEQAKALDMVTTEMTKQQKTLEKLGDLSKGNAKAEARVSQLTAIINTAEAVTKFIAQGSFGKAALAALMGAKEVATIEGSISKFATGADYVAEQPELIMVGESNRERVQVTPLEDVNLEGGTSGITLNISGNVLHDSFVEDQIIPSIKEGLRRGGSIA